MCLPRTVVAGMSWQRCREGELEQVGKREPYVTEGTSPTVSQVLCSVSSHGQCKRHLASDPVTQGKLYLGKPQLLFIYHVYIPTFS